MSQGEIPTLMIFTLVAALVVAVLMYVRFMRKPDNRHPMQGKRERSIDEIRDEAPGDRP